MEQFRFSSRNFIFSFVASFFFFGSYYLLLPTLPDYMVKTGVSMIQTGLAVGIFTFVSVLARPCFGKLADAYGRKRLMLFGAGLFAIVYLLYIGYCQVNEITLIYFLRLVHGLGYAAFIPASMAYVADLAPSERRGEVMGIFGITNVLAMALFPAFGIAIVRYTNSFSVLCTVGAFFASAAFLASMMVREVEISISKISNNSLAMVAQQRVIIVSAAVMFAGTIIYGALTTFLPLYASERGFSEVGMFFTMYALGSLGSRLIIGKVSDRIGRYKIIVPALALLGLASFLLIALYQFYILIISGICAGLGFGALVPTLLALVADKTKPQERGVALGFITSFLDLGISAGAVALGFVGEYWGYPAMFGIGGCFAVCGMLVIIFNVNTLHVSHNRNAF